MANQFVGVPPDGAGKKVQTFENTVGGNVVEAQAMALVDQFGVPLAERGDNYLKVAGDPATLLYDTFEALDTANTWTAGGTVAPTINAGYLWLNPGTAASASSTLVSKPVFQPGSSAYLQFAGLVALEAAATPGNQRVWGLGVFGTPTLSAPVTNGTVYELDSASGGLFASVYSAGARTQSAALTRPADALSHRYAIYYKASRVYFELDNVVVATLAFPNPAVALLNLAAASINGASALSAAPTLAVSLIGLGDTARNASGVADGAFPWRRATVKPGSTPAAAADNGLVVTPHPSGTQAVGQSNPALLNATVAQGASAALANAWLARLTDGANISGVTAKGTQGAFALATQSLLDAGRSAMSLFVAVPVLATAADTLQSLTGLKAGAAVAATTTPAVVSAGKTLRVGSLTATYVGMATAGSVRITLRAQPGGVVTINSPAVMTWTVGPPAAAAGAATTVAFPSSEGLEFPAGTGLGISVVGQSATMAATAGLGYCAVTLLGFEY